MATGALAQRQVVLDILTEYGQSKGYSNLLIRRALDAHPELSREQRAFVKRLTEGTIERLPELDQRIRRNLRNPSDRLNRTVQSILRMAVYEIYYMDTVTDYAAVNEAVRLVRAQDLPQFTGFVNGVLRSVCRQKNAGGAGRVYVAGRKGAVSVRRETAGSVTEPECPCAKPAPSGTVAGTGQENRIAASMLSMPESIVSLWTQDYGRETAEALVKAMEQTRPVCIRLDARLTPAEREAVLSRLSAQGVDVEPGRWLPYAASLRHVGKLTELPGFAEGQWTVQDESSMLVCEAAGLTRAPRDETEEPSPCPVVLDLCAAPGGKSLHAASLIPAGTVYSFDLTRSRTNRIRENAARLRLTNLVIEEHDAEVYDPALEEKADVVLCDVPCSGLGVIARKKDIKYGFSIEKLHSLCALQKRILRNAVHYVKPGGVLIYSTCTIDKAENDQMARFLARSGGLQPDALAPYLPADLPGIRGNMVQLMPQIHGTDGFFLTRFVRQ